MDRIKKHNRFRVIVQAVSFAFSNGYLNGFIKGKIYTGPLKKVCLPGLNCYSCPGAVFACPIGALQTVLGTSGYRFSLYVLGFIGLVGALFGRLICGFICPFGFVQDLLHKIPVPHKRKNMPGHEKLKYLKYVVLLVFVIALPILITDSTGTGSPWFCEFICPDGTLFGGIPLALYHPEIRDALSWKFFLKLSVLAVIQVSSVWTYRPFCKYLCPLGALYSLTNPISAYRYEVDHDKCVECGLCRKVCGMDIEVDKTPNSPECIRCGKCKTVCPKGAITSSLDRLEKKIAK